MKKIVPDFSHMSQFSGPEESLGYLLWRVSLQWRRSIEETLKQCELTHPQFVVLASVGWLAYAKKSCIQRTISGTTGMDPNTISQIVRGLEKRRLIERAHSSDERSKDVGLTSQGARLLERAMALVEQRDGVVFDVLSAQAQQTLIALFQKMLDEESKPVL